jgi:superfamily II DNA/RNA helicase
MSVFKARKPNKLNAKTTFIDTKGDWEATLSATQRGKKSSQMNEQYVKQNCPSGSFDPFKIPLLMKPIVPYEEQVLIRKNAGEKLNKKDTIIINNYLGKQKEMLKIDMMHLETQGLNAKMETKEGKIRLLFKIIEFLISRFLNDMVYNTFNKILEFNPSDELLKEYNPLIINIKKIIAQLDTVELQFNKFHTSMPPLNESGFVQLDDFQKEVITNIDNNVSTIVSAPTSAGKSVMTGYLYTKKNKLGGSINAIVVVPSDPLAWQMSAMISKIIDKDVPIITRTFQSETVRDELVKKVKSIGVVVGTPQYLVDYLPLFDKEGCHFDWVVIDEIHMIGNDNCKEMELIIKRYNTVPILALSATIGNIEELQKWFKLNGQDISVVKCTKRFINLQKWYVETVDNESIFHRISPLSSVSIEDFNNKSVLSKSLNPTPPDIWDLAMKLDKILPKELKIHDYFITITRITLDQANEYFDKIIGFMVECVQNKKHSKIINSIINSDNTAQDANIEYDLYNVVIKLKRENKTPAIVFQTDSHLCLDIVRKLSKRFRDEEERAHPTLMKERVSLLSRSKSNEKKIGQEITVTDKYGKKKSVNINMNSIGDKKMTKLMMTDQIEKMEEHVIDISIYEPHPDFIMNLTQPFNQHMIDNWNKELKQYFPQNGCEYHYIIDLLWRGIGVYAKGLPEPYLHIIQNLACSGKLGLVFSDESLVFGVSMPFRTSIITPDRNINSMMYHQMAGRAGRRGLDKEGNVMLLGYNWTQIKELTTSVIPDVAGCDTMFYGSYFASKLSGNDQWNNIMSNFLKHSITNDDANEFYSNISDTLEDGWKFAVSDNFAFNHMLWRLRHSEDVFRIAFLVIYIRKLFHNCEYKNENIQIEFAKFISHFIDVHEANNDAYVLEPLSIEYPIGEHLETLGIDNQIEKIDSKVFECIRLNSIIIKSFDLNGHEKSKLRERLMNFGEKIRNIQHYFYHCREQPITRLLSKLLTRIWWIYHSSSPVMEPIKRYEEITFDVAPEDYHYNESSSDDEDDDDEEAS